MVVVKGKGVKLAKVYLSIDFPSAVESQDMALFAAVLLLQQLTKCSSELLLCKAIMPPIIFI